MHLHFLSVVVLARAALAQTYTNCNPTEKTCGADPGLDQTTYSVDFTKGSSDDWNMTYGTVSYDSTNGAAFTISASGDAPTMESTFNIFFGVVSVFMRAAPGTGIVSCAILESDDLDEIDWEWLGGSANQVETNYFGKGNTTSYDRATYVDVDDSQNTVHNYTIEWTSAYTTWWIDGTAVRTLNYADAVDGKNYPQTPMTIRLGLWAGGDSSQSEGTIEWAGGETDYSDGPFTMYLQKIEITNYNPGSSYTYGDMTGDYTSIKIGSSDSSSASSSSTSTSTASSSSSSSSSATGSKSSGSTSANSSSSSSNSSSSVNSSASNSTSTASTSTSTGSSSSSSSTSAASISAALTTTSLTMGTRILGMSIAALAMALFL